MLREKKGLTQAEVAQQLGVTPAAVSKWENGSSKPRVEVLFKLAEILDAKPEELMAGHYINQETINPEAIKRINERYEYLRKIDNHAATSTKLKRAAAWFIDWNIIGLTVLFVVSLLLEPILLGENPASDGIYILSFIVILMYPVTFALRDLIFGRSIGKRIMGLTVLDIRTGEPAKRLQKFARGLFMFLMQFDFVVMLISGKSIGDYVAHTVVVSQKDIEAKNENSLENINGYKAPSRFNKKAIIAVVLSIIIIISVVVGIVLLVLEQQKDTEEYKFAYDVLVNDDDFKQMRISEEDIRLSGYSKTTRSVQGGERITIIEYEFNIGRVELYCHEDGTISVHSLTIWKRIA